ncbi:MULTISPECIES: alpha/beta hydrolase [unclassified Nocardiopsis]|uniref:alpha/beta hydrolase n=1 Tax=unclassified Nocardiopsis TaxID=2649073 RepID=UPI00066EE1CF|nr:MULTISPECIES: alpha/beta hydrolase [unclassified Nocardiopsis]MBQ1083024.1 alpha/beta fold hydrolase [Nocardiopsis sp. B62]
MSTRPPAQRGPRCFTIGLAVVTLLLLAACTPGSPSSGADPGLDPYLEQDVDWGGCEERATTAVDAELFADPALECASVEVPIDYDDPQAERAQIALMRLPATGEAEAEGSLLINPGGPGGSGMSFVASLLPMWQDNPIAERFDVVGFDPRGVGASTPSLGCHTDEERDAGDVPGFAAVYDITSAEQATELAQRCIDGSGGVDNLVNAGTTNVVRDVDILRAALGDEQLTYLGYSYGSELGAMYAATYPDKVRAIVLDGATSPELTALEFRRTQFIAAQERFDDVAALCAETSDCVLGPDPAKATDRLHEILEPVVENPVLTSDGREVSVWDVYLGLTAGLASESTWPEVVSALTELDAGDADEMLVLRDSYFERGPDAVYARNLDTNIAVRCMDWPRPTSQELTEHARELGDVAPMYDLDLLTGGTFHSECEAWPAPPTRNEPWLPADVEDLPETLVVSITGDPATPHGGGVAMAEALGANLLTVDGKQHGAYLLGGSSCVDEVVETYLLDLQTPPDDATCSL